MRRTLVLYLYPEVDAALRAARKASPQDVSLSELVNRILAEKLGVTIRRETGPLLRPAVAGKRAPRAN